MKIKYLSWDNAVVPTTVFQVHLMFYALMFYLRLPSVHFHLTEVLPLGVPAGFLQARLGDPSVDFLPRGFE